FWIVLAIARQFAARPRLQSRASNPTRADLGAACAHSRSTSSSFMRPDAPALTWTAALRQWDRSATRATRSCFALPATGGDFNFASQVPSGSCSSDDVRAFGFTLTLKVNDAILSALSGPWTAEALGVIDTGGASGLDGPPFR